MKEENRITEGNVVKLNSNGGPQMTVVSLSKDSQNVSCIWYDSELNSFQTYCFSPNVLKLVE